MFKTYLSHQIDSAAANFMLEIIPLDHANAVLARGRTFHLDSAFDHAMDKVFCETMFLVVVEKYGCMSQSRTEWFIRSRNALP